MSGPDPPIELFVLEIKFILVNNQYTFTIIFSCLLSVKLGDFCFPTQQLSLEMKAKEK